MQLKAYLYGFTALIAFAKVSYGAEVSLKRYAEDKEYDRYSMFTDEKVNEAKAEGIELGKAEGEKIAKLEVARGMLADNLPIQSIVKYTGLTEADIETLIK